MKRLFILLLYIVSAVSIYANPPKLNVENLFDGRYNNNRNHQADSRGHSQRSATGKGLLRLSR